jgi:hypothetical protein
MKLKMIAVHYERKFNMGDYNSAAVGIDLWADLDDGEDVSAATAALYAEAKAQVKEQALPLVGKHEAQQREIFLGLPVEVQQAALAAAQQGQAQGLPLRGGRRDNGATN